MKNKTAKILLAALTAASLTSMPVMAADASDYILLLPKTEGVTYEMAQDHVADQYSNNQYTVLLYKEGETVDLTVSGATDFAIKDAMDSDTTDYAASETDGKVSFTMPAEDLSLSVNNVSEEAVAAAKAASETETETQAQSETEAAQELNQGGSSQAVPSDIRIASTRVNVRESADTNANKIAVLTPGQRVRVLSEENGWTRLQYVDENKNLVEGSVKSDYLTNTSALYTAKANVNVRASASEKAEKLGKAEKGSEVVVIENEQDGWAKVCYVSGNTVKDGFIKADYLEQEAASEIDELLRK